MVETETCLKVKCLRSDNEGEYIDGEYIKCLSIMLHTESG